MLVLLMMMTSCYTYIDYRYKGYETVEYIDTIKLSPIHYHSVRDSSFYCVWIDEFRHPYKSVYVIECWDARKRKSIIKR